jgi:hypothetical protein
MEKYQYKISGFIPTLELSHDILDLGYSDLRLVCVKNLMWDLLPLSERYLTICVRIYDLMVVIGFIFNKK